MATYNLTVGNDVVTGTADADTFDGYFPDDGLGVAGGTDTLNGSAGNDVFLLNFGSAGTINGGADTDTVRLLGWNLGTTTFSAVEVLDVIDGSVTATTVQLAAFTTITNSASPDSSITFRLSGAGGTIDFSNRVAADHSITAMDVPGLKSGYNVTGSNNGDSLGGSRFNDTLNGGGGNDTIHSSGGVDTLNGSGDDTFNISDGAGVVDGGGTDTVISTNLGNL